MQGKERQEVIFMVKKGLKFALYLLGSNEADIPCFFVNRNEFVAPDCVRQYLGLAVRCRRHDFLANEE